MKRLGDVLNRVIVAGLVLAAAAVFLVGRTAVERHYDYREMVAAKSLHQLSQETRAGGDDGRSHLALYGAGLFAISMLALGGMLFAMRSGEEFGKRAGKRARRRPTEPRRVGQPPELRSMPHAPTLPALPAGEYDEDVRH